jgi:hypothetical protein
MVTSSVLLGRCVPSKATPLYPPRHGSKFNGSAKVRPLSLGTILVIILINFLLGGFSGRFGGYGYGFGHGGVGILGAALIVIVIPMLLGRI